MPEATWQSSLSVDGLASPDTSWVVEYDPDAQRLQFHVFEPDGGTWQGQSDILRTSLPDLVERTVEGAEKKDESLQRLLLSGLGADLWRDCVPADLKALFEERSDSWKGLQIISRDESVPWEMLWPSKGGAEPQLFLAERLPICRWVPGSQPTKTLRRQHPCLVSASDAEPSTTTELSSVQRLLGAMREGVEPPISSRDRLLQRMKEGDFDWLHFTGHRYFDIDDPTASALHLGNEKFQAAYLGTMEGRWKGQEPFVFFNACRTSGSSPRLTQLDGWAQRCLRAGAAGFAGTSWAVRSDAALRFATTFYENLSKNQPVGAAFFDARLQTRDAIAGNCSWLAYVAYAHSQATLAPLVEV